MERVDILTQILIEWDNDSKMDPLNLGNEPTRIGKLHAKYLRYLSDHKMKAKMAEFKYNKLRKTKWMYFTGKLNGTVELDNLGWEPFPYTLKTDVNNFIDGDEDLNNLKIKQIYNEQIVDACQLILKELHNRTYQVRARIDWERFIGGN